MVWRLQTWNIFFQTPIQIWHHFGQPLVGGLSKQRTVTLEWMEVALWTKWSSSRECVACTTPQSFCSQVPLLLLIGFKLIINLVLNGFKLVCTHPKITPTVVDITYKCNQLHIPRLHFFLLCQQCHGLPEVQYQPSTTSLPPHSARRALGTSFLHLPHI